MKNPGHARINRRTREFTQEDITQVADTYHHWLNSRDTYNDIPVFCKSSSIEDIKAMDYVLTPGRYIGLPDDEDDFNFIDRFTKLRAELEAQMKEEVILNERIRINLSSLSLPGEN